MPFGSLAGPGSGVDDEHFGLGAVGAPHLRAVQHVAAAAPLGAAGHADHIGARPRFAHRKRPDMFAGDELGQVAALLFPGAVAPDLVDAEIGVGPVGQADGGRGPADLLHGHDMGGVAQSRPAVFLLDGDPEQPEGAELRPEVAREGIVAVDRVGTRGDLVGGEGLDRGAQHVDGVAEAEIERGQGVGSHGEFLMS